MVAELALHFDNSSGAPRDPAGEAVLRALCLRWAELDAPGMIAALQSPGYRYTPQVRQFAVSAWAELRGAVAVQTVAKQWPALARRAAWEIVWRQPGQMETLLPWLGREADLWCPLSDRARLIALLGRSGLSIWPSPPVSGNSPPPWSAGYPARNRCARCNWRNRCRQASAGMARCTPC
jgi:hypothetical protein